VSGPKAAEPVQDYPEKTKNRDIKGGKGKVGAHFAKRLKTKRGEKEGSLTPPEKREKW